MFFYHIFLAFCCCLLFMRINIYIQWSHAYRTTKTIVKRYALSLCLHISGDFIHPFGCYKAHTTYFFRCVVLCIFSCDFPRLAVCAFLPSHMPHNNILSVFFYVLLFTALRCCAGSEWREHQRTSRGIGVGEPILLRHVQWYVKQMEEKKYAQEL